MKKVLAVAAILGAVSTLSVESHAMRGEVQVGTEVEEYNGKYGATENFVLPFVAGKLYPVADSPFYVEAKFSYRDKDNDEKKASDRRKRYEFYTGYAWKWDNFSFTPKAGIRFENYASGEDESRQATNDTVTNWRFYPNMSYKVNDEASLFLSGFLAYRQSDLNDGKRRKDGSTGADADEYGVKYDDYNHELETGVRYKLPNSQQLQVSIYNEYTRAKNDSSTEEWQLRLRYNHKLENGKTTISPWVRIGLDREQRDHSGRNQGEKDRLRHRLGLTASHNVTSDFSVFGEINWQTERVEDYSNNGGERNSDKNRTLYKLGFKQKF